MTSLIERINSGEFDSDMVLPPENDLAKEYGVSRITIRKALEEMKVQDYIFRKQGKGTFISRAREDEKFSKKAKLGLGEIIRSAGKTLDRIQLAKHVRPVGEVGTKLKMDSNDPSLFYQRIYTADGVPVFFVESIINHTKFPGIENYDYNYISLSVLISQVFGATLYCKDSEIHSIKAERAAEYLKLSPDDPVLYLTYTSFLKSDNTMIPFEIIEIFARTDTITIDPEQFR